MNQFFKKAFVLFALISSTSVFAQEQPFTPKFTLGSGSYTLTGDIQNENTGFLKGIAGFNAGMKFDLAKNLDLSFLFVKTAFSADNGTENFKSDIDGFGLHLGYTVNQIFKQSKISPLLSLGVQNFNVRNDGENSSAITVPLGFGLRMNISDRLQFDIAMNFGMGLGDIDMSKENEGKADGYKSLNFTMHYDLFTPKPKENTYFDDSYYQDVDFAKLESEDEDGDLVADVDDFCPKTPIGVKVDDNGCPLDDDKDGIPNYLDQQKNTVKGSIVDENGVQLTNDKYRSMYSDYEAASREYANFYNENEIKRENYKTIDAYLIAKANAFNKAYNDGEVFDNTVNGLKYKVKIGAFIDGVPANIINKYLSLDDLESIPQDDGMVIYSVGAYNSLEEALGREYELEAKGFDDTYILVDNNGSVSNYVIPVPEPIIDEEEIVLPVVEEDEIEKITEEETVISSNETTYRIQIGAFDKELSDKVFEGVDNVVSFSGKDGLVRYMAGSFTEYKDAINYQAQMKARGFEDAFIVTYKNGERISLNIAIKIEKNSSKSELVVEEEVVKPNIEFIVQVLMIKPNVEFEVEVLMTKPNVEFIIQIVVTEISLTTEDLDKMSKLGNIDKEAKGEEMYRYFAGTYSSFSDANIRLEEARLVGYPDAFVFAKLDGKRITLEETRYPEIFGTYPSLDAANIRLAEVKLAGYADALVFAKLDGDRVTLEQAKHFNTLGTYTSLKEANIRLAEAKLAGYADAFVFAKLEGERITIEQAIALLK
jgi:hypothetical protein